MTTEASPHTMPSMVSAERRRFRISACQPCEISSLRNMVLAVLLVHPNVARAGAHRNFRTAAPYLPADVLAHFLHPSLHRRRDRLINHDAARAGQEVNVEGCLLGDLDV